MIFGTLIVPFAILLFNFRYLLLKIGSLERRISSNKSLSLQITAMDYQNFVQQRHVYISLEL